MQIEEKELRHHFFQIVLPVYLSDISLWSDCEGRGCRRQQMSVASTKAKTRRPKIFHLPFAKHNKAKEVKPKAFHKMDNRE